MSHYWCTVRRYNMIDQERMVLDREFNFIYDGSEDLIEGLSHVKEQIRSDIGRTLETDLMGEETAYWGPYRGYTIRVDVAYTHAQMVEKGLLDPDEVELDPKIWGWLTGATK